MAGDFIKEINQFSESAVIRDIINLPNGNFLCYCFDFSDGYKYAGLWEVDSKGEFLKMHLDRKYGYPFVLNEDYSYLYPMDDGVGLSCGDVNEIYHFRQDSLYKYLSYEIKNGMSIEDVKNNKISKGDGYVSKIKTQEKGNILLTEWSDEENRSFISLFSKKDNIVKTLRWIKFKNS